MAEEKEFNVDEALERLEEINRELSKEGISLADSLKLYKEGVELSAKCKAALDDIEKEIIILTPEEE